MNKTAQLFSSLLIFGLFIMLRPAGNKIDR